MSSHAGSLGGKDYDFMNYRKSAAELRREQEKEQFNEYVQARFRNNVNSRQSSVTSEGASHPTPQLSEKERYRQELLDQMNRGRDVDFEARRRGRLSQQQPAASQHSVRPASGLRRNTASDSSQMNSIFGGYEGNPGARDQGRRTPTANADNVNDNNPNMAYNAPYSSNMPNDRVSTPVRPPYGGPTIPSSSHYQSPFPNSQYPNHLSPLAPGVLPRRPGRAATPYGQQNPTVAPNGIGIGGNGGGSVNSGSSNGIGASRARSALGGVGAVVIGSNGGVGASMGANNGSSASPGMGMGMGSVNPGMGSVNHGMGMYTHVQSQGDILDRINHTSSSSTSTSSSSTYPSEGFTTSTPYQRAPAPMSVLDTGFYANYQQDLRALASRQQAPLAMQMNSGMGTGVGLGMGMGMGGQMDSLQSAVQPHHPYQQHHTQQHSQQQQQHQQSYQQPPPPQPTPDLPFSILSSHPSSHPSSTPFSFPSALPTMARLPPELFMGKGAGNQGPVAAAVGAGLGQSRYAGGWSGSAGIGMGVGGVSNAYGADYGSNIGNYGSNLGIYSNIPTFPNSGINSGNVPANPYISDNQYTNNNNYAPPNTGLGIGTGVHNSGMGAPTNSTGNSGGPPTNMSDLTPQQRYKLELEAQMRADKERKANEKNKYKQELHEGAVMLSNYDPWGKAGGGNRNGRGVSRGGVPSSQGHGGDEQSGQGGYGGNNMGGEGAYGGGYGGMGAGTDMNAGNGNNNGGDAPRSGNAMYIQMQEAIQRKEEEKRRQKLEEEEEERKIQRERDILEQRYRQEQEREKADKERREREKMEKMGGKAASDAPNKDSAHGVGGDAGVNTSFSGKPPASHANQPAKTANMPATGNANDDDAKYDEPPPPGLGSGARTKWLRKQQEREKLREQGLL